MGTASSYPSDFTLVLDDRPGALGYQRAEVEGKTLRQLMWSDQRSAAAAVMRSSTG